VISSPWWVFPRPFPIDVTIPTDSREECSQNVAEWNDTVTVQKVFHRRVLYENSGASLPMLHEIDMLCKVHRLDRTLWNNNIILSEFNP
jgi:hypothetical protein